MWMSHGTHIACVWQNSNARDQSWLIHMYDIHTKSDAHISICLWSEALMNVTHMDPSRHIFEWVMSHVWMSCVAHMNELCHTYPVHMCDMTHLYLWHSCVRWCTMLVVGHTCTVDSKACDCWGWTRLIHREWFMPHIWMSHVTRMNASWHTYECVKWHTWVSHVTRMNASCDMYEWVMSHMRVLNKNASCHMYDRVMSHEEISRVTHMNESCHTYEWVCWARTSHDVSWHELHNWILSHTWMSDGTHEWVMAHMDESSHTYEWILSHTWMNGVTHGWVMSPMIVVPYMRFLDKTPGHIFSTRPFMCDMTHHDITSQHMTHHDTSSQHDINTMTRACPKRVVTSHDSPWHVSWLAMTHLLNTTNLVVDKTSFHESIRHELDHTWISHFTHEWSCHTWNCGQDTYNRDL